MAAEVKGAVKVEPLLIEGKDGIFTVRIDGQEVFSKDRLHRFPENGEVARLVHAH